MPAPVRPPLTRLAAATVAAFALATAGCDYCIEHVEWLPDSSGFVFTDREHARLVHFDVGKKARRVVVEAAGVRCPWPAVSPDGTQFALVSRTRTTTAGTRQVRYSEQVLIYDRQGKVTRRSQVLDSADTDPEPAGESGTRTVAGHVCWKGHQDRLVVPTAIYDRVKDRWVSIPGTPCVLPVHEFAPTEKGFLTSRSVKAKDAVAERLVLSFVDWDGWSADLDTPSDLTLGRGVQGKWVGATWQVVTADGVLAIDTAKRKVQFSAGADPTWDSLHRPDQYHRLAGGDLFLAVFSEYDKEAMSNKTRLELQIPVKNKRRVVYAEGEYSAITLFPSPDGKRVAAWCRRAAEVTVGDPKQPQTAPRVTRSERNTIVVFDQAGEVVGSVDPE